MRHAGSIMHASQKSQKKTSARRREEKRLSRPSQKRRKRRDGGERAAHAADNKNARTTFLIDSQSRLPGFSHLFIKNACICPPVCVSWRTTLVCLPAYQEGARPSIFAAASCACERSISSSAFPGCTMGRQMSGSTRKSPTIGPS